MSKEVPTTTPDNIFVTGERLHKAVVQRVTRLEDLRNHIVSEAAELLALACGAEEDVLEKAVELMVALKDGHGLGAQALTVQAYIERCAQINKELRELSRFGNTIQHRFNYRLSWDEAERFGL